MKVNRLRGLAKLVSHRYIYPLSMLLVDKFTCVELVLDDLAAYTFVLPMERSCFSYCCYLTGSTKLFFLLKKYLTPL